MLGVLSPAFDLLSQLEQVPKTKKKVPLTGKLGARAPGRLGVFLSLPHSLEIPALLFQRPRWSVASKLHFTGKQRWKEERGQIGRDGKGQKQIE